MSYVATIPGVSLLVQDALFDSMGTQRGAVRDGTGRASPTVKRDTKAVGDRSEAIVLAALVNKGYFVSIPFGENHRYDLLADDGNRLYRVQVKTGRLRGGVIKYNCCSSHAHRNGGSRSYFGEVDFIAVYCFETRKVYLLPESALVATQGHLRVAPTKNNMVKTIRWASQYELA